MRFLALSIAIVCLNFVSLATAADRRIEGVVTALDADHLSVTVKTQAGGTEQEETLDILKKAKVSVNGKTAPLQEVRTGQKIVIIYNSELEVATVVEATGEGLAEPELVVLKELPNGDGNQSAPYVSEDGLTLYWKARKVDEKQPWIWSAHRKSPNDLFEDAKRLVPGNDPALTPDGLELILLDEQSLFSCKRPSVNATFPRPQKIAEFEKLGFLGSPCFSGDGLTLYADHIDFKARTVTSVKFERESRTAKWGERQVVKLSGLNNNRVRFFQVTPDDKYLCCSVHVTTNYEEEPVLMVLRADAAGTGFASPRVVMVNGKVILGKFPRYVAATHELFFARNRPEAKADELVVIRNFDPDSMPKFPLAESAAPKGNSDNTAKDLQKMNGEWLTITTETNGKTTSKAEDKLASRRIVIKGNSFTMTRVVNGKLGTYAGKFEINAKTKNFDWKGNGPNGMHVELRGIYSLDGDTLNLCYKYVKDSGTTRPTEFKTSNSEGTSFVCLTLKRD